ncbi:MAG: ATP synthase F0 subunit B [Bryobacteraceae bacterium]
MHNRRFCIPLLAGLLFSTAALHLSAQPAAAGGSPGPDTVSLLKIFNTGLFFAFLAWLIYKYAPKFFQARSLAIQKAIEEATGLKIEAEFRHSEIDRKMATLPEEVRQLRARETAERQRDHRRFQRETEGAMAHVRRNAQAEIEAYWLQGMRQVKERTADLALQFAEQHVPERIGPRESEESVRDVIHLVGQEDHRGGKSR